MAKKMEKSKVYEPDWFEQPPLPESVAWENVTDAPRSVSEISISDGIALANATTTIGSLGDLAYEDLVDTLQLSDEAVTNAKIAVDAITEDVVAAGAITEVKISNDAISAAKIQAAAITAAKIDTGAITATKIASGAVIAGKIDAGAVTAGTIAAGAIDGVTITGSLIRTSSSTTRVEMNASNNDLRIYNSGTLRAKGYQQGWEYYNDAGTLVGQIYASSTEGFLIGGDIVSTGKIYYGAGSSGSHGFYIGTSGSTLRFFFDTDSMIIGGASYMTVDIYGEIDLNGGGLTLFDGDINMNGNNISNIDALSSFASAITINSNISMSAYDITCDDINANVVNADVLQLAGGGYIDDARALYFETGRTTHTSVSGEMRYYDGASKYFEGYVNGFRGSFDLTSV